MASMRSIANVNISLGLFGFPVKVYKAINDATEGIGFTQLHGECSTPINQIKYCAKCDRKVEYSELVKGHLLPDGTYLKVNEADLKALRPEAAGVIKISGYLAGEEIDPCYQGGEVYFLSPDGKDTTTFTTWRNALKGRWAVGSVVMYGREHIVAIRALDRMLSMHYIRNHAEIRRVSDVPQYDKVPETSPAQYADLMGQLIEGQMIAFDEVVLESDSYVDAIKAMLAARVAGLEPPTQSEAKPASAGIDLMAMLKASKAALDAKRQAA